MFYTNLKKVFYHRHQNMNSYINKDASNSVSQHSNGVLKHV